MTPSIGKTLRQERESRKLSLEDVSLVTKINIRILENLEAGEIEKLPSGLYARSFLKQYADFLGLDSNVMLQKYQGASIVEKKGFAEETGSFWKKNKIFLNALSITCIVLTVIIVWRGIAVLSHKVQVLKQANGISLSTARLSQAPQFLIPKNAPLEVTLRAIEPTWVQVRVDDQIVFQNVLAKESSEVWHPKEKAELWVGNAGGVEVLLNRKLLGKPGKRGQVMKGILLTREGMRIL